MRNARHPGGRKESVCACMRVMLRHRDSFLCPSLFLSASRVTHHERIHLQEVTSDEAVTAPFSWPFVPFAGNNCICIRKAALSPSFSLSLSFPE